MHKSNVEILDYSFWMQRSIWLPTVKRTAPVPIGASDVKYLIRIALTAASLASIHPVTRGDTLDLSPPALQQAAFAAAQAN